MTEVFSPHLQIPRAGRRPAVRRRRTIGRRRRRGRRQGRVAEGVPGHLGVLPDGRGGGGAVGQEEGEATALGVLLLLLLLELLVEELGSQGAEGLAVQLEFLQVQKAC